MPRKSSPSPAANLSYGAMLGWALPRRPGVRPEQSQLAACGTSRLSAVSNSVTSTFWPLPVCWRAASASRMPVSALYPVT